jgi:hypothetical protein
MDTILVLWALAWGNNAYNELTQPPPVVKVEKLEVDPKLYYPDLAEDMWDPNWINKKG